MAAKTMAEVVWRPSVEEGNMGLVAVAAKAMAEGGRVAGWRGGGGDRSNSRRGVQWLFSEVIDDHSSTDESWNNTSPNNDGGGGGGGGGRGGGGGEKNCHTPSSYWRRTVILPDCTDSRGGVLDVVHCCRVGGGGVGGVGGIGSVGGVGSGGAYPSDDRKDNDMSNGRGGTRHHRCNCDDVAGYRLRHIS